MRRYLTITLVLLTLCISLPALSENSKKIPVLNDTKDGPKLELPDDVDEYLLGEFPTYRVLDEKEFNPEMLKYFFSNLIGVHPAVAFGDFNGDKKQDFALLLVTGESKWGPIVELIILNGEGRRGQYTTFRLGEIYNYKDDYVSFSDGKLMKAKYKKHAWFITWDKKNKTYVVAKS